MRFVTEDLSEWIFGREPKDPQTMRKEIYDADYKYKEDVKNAINSVKAKERRRDFAKAQKYIDVHIASMPAEFKKCFEKKTPKDDFIAGKSELTLLYTISIYPIASARNKPPRDKNITFVFRKYLDQFRKKVKRVNVVNYTIDCYGGDWDECKVFLIRDKRKPRYDVKPSKVRPSEVKPSRNKHFITH